MQGLHLRGGLGQLAGMWQTATRQTDKTGVNTFGLQALLIRCLSFGNALHIAEATGLFGPGIKNSETFP